MKIRRCCAVLFAGFFVCTVLSGCGYRELHQRILIQGIGVDKTGDGYTVTVRAASPEEEAGDELYSCQGGSVLEALSKLSLSTGREPFYSHNYLVVFGRSCGEEGLDKSMDFFIRYYNTRPTVQMYLAEDTAEEILSAKMDDKMISIQTLQNLGQTGKYNGKAVSMDFLEFVNSAQRPGSSPVLPVVGIKWGKAELCGTAYFQNYQLAGILDLEETRGYLAIKGKLRNGEIVVKGDDFGTVTLTVSQGKSETEISSKDDIPNFRTVYQVTADVSTISGEHGKLDESFYASVEEKAAQQIREEMTSALEKSLMKGQCDIFGFGNLFWQKEPEEWKKISQQWDEEMLRCNYEIQVEATVLRMEQGSLNGGK